MLYNTSCTKTFIQKLQLKLFKSLLRFFLNLTFFQVSDKLVLEICHHHLPFSCLRDFTLFQNCVCVCVRVQKRERDSKAFENEGVHTVVAATWDDWNAHARVEKSYRRRKNTKKCVWVRVCMSACVSECVYISCWCSVITVKFMESVCNLTRVYPVVVCSCKPLNLSISQTHILCFKQENNLV